MSTMSASLRRSLASEAFAVVIAAATVASTIRESHAQPAMNAAISYQGVLRQNGTPLDGTCDVQMSLWNAATTGTQIGSTLTFLNIAVSDGQISLTPNFQAWPFDGSDRWLQIAVRSPAGVGGYTTLAPRDRLRPVPYALSLALPYFTQRAANTSLLGLTNTQASAEGVTGALAAPLGGVIGVHNATGNIGYLGMAEYGVLGRTDIWPGGAAVRGEHVKTGAYAELGSASAGVWAAHPLTGNTGSIANSLYGVSGNSEVATGAGVFGQYQVVGTNSIGLLGTADSGVRAHLGGITTRLATTDYGVDARVGPGAVAGVYGSWVGASGNPFTIGILGGTSHGVYGYRDSQTGAAVAAESTEITAFDFYALGPGNDYGSASSIRWKRDVRNIDNPLEKIAHLRGVYFDWDADHGGHHDVGMIAEEVGAVLPEIVQYEANGIDASGMDYSKMTPLLVEAVRALREEKDRQLAERDQTIARQQTEIEAMRLQLAAVESAVNRLTRATQNTGRNQD